MPQIELTPFLESFLFGAANSLHCACMCGPLALAFGVGGAAAAAYQTGRGLAYAALGTGLGAGGALLGSDRIAAPAAAVAFVLAAGLLVLAVAGDRALRLPGLGQVVRPLLAAVRGLPPLRRAFVCGVATPLLPCGLLWSACAGAAVSGSAVAGGTVMLGFALGSLPLLLLAQHRARALMLRIPPRTLALVQRAALLVAAAVLAVRGAMALSGGGCCH